MRCHFLFACFSDAGPDRFSPKKRLEPCSEDGSSDVDGEDTLLLTVLTSDL